MRIQNSSMQYNNIIRTTSKYQSAKLFISIICCYNNKTKNSFHLSNLPTKLMSALYRIYCKLCVATSATLNQKSCIVKLVDIETSIKCVKH